PQRSLHPFPTRRSSDLLVIKCRQMTASAGQADPVKSGGGVSVDVRARVQPEAPEQPLLAPREVLVGHVEGRGHRKVLRGHQLQRSEEHTSELQSPCNLV